MKPRVKICGITRLADARLAARLGADFLGFNFHEGSPRRIAPAQAARIIRRMPPGARAVGVFVDAPAGDIEEVAAQTGIRIVQLHGCEPPEVVVRLGRKFTVWKAVRVKRGFRAGSIQRFREADAILLDAFRRGLRGGTGVAFDWLHAASARRHARIILAGGLNAGNVAEAIRVARPYAVDVASGVESSPGRKCKSKMHAFFAAIGKM